MMIIEEMIKVLEAAGQKKVIQYKEQTFPQNIWVDVEEPSWNFDKYEYRIKPEPLKCWANEYKDRVAFFPTDREAIALATSNAIRVAVPMVEEE